MRFLQVFVPRVLIFKKLHLLTHSQRAAYGEYWLHLGIVSTLPLLSVCTIFVQMSGCTFQSAKWLIDNHLHFLHWKIKTGICPSVKRYHPCIQQGCSDWYCPRSSRRYDQPHGRLRGCSWSSNRCHTEGVPQVFLCKFQDRSEVRRDVNYCEDA